MLVAASDAAADFSEVSLLIRGDPTGRQRLVRAAVVSWKLFCLAGVLVFVAVMMGADRLRVPDSIVLIAAGWASLALTVLFTCVALRARNRRHSRRTGTDLCPCCTSPIPLAPNWEHCPLCGAPRACSGCGHLLEAGQCTCPECGRAVSGRNSRTLQGAR
jgi:RNA polymerase subunit RPABC4/transcription elongation factor Spt4